MMQQNVPETNNLIAPQPPQYNFSEPQKTSGKKKILVIISAIIGVIILLLVISGIALATRIWEPAWSPFRLKPEVAIEKMFDKMINTESFHAKADFSVKEQNDNKMIFTANLDGDLGLTMSNYTFNIQALIPFFADDVSVAMTVEGRTVEGNSYYKIKELTVPPSIEEELAATGLPKSDLQKNWYRIGMDGMKVADSKINGSVDNYQINLIKTIIGKIFSDKSYRVEKEMADENVGGVSAYHYVVVFDKEKMTNILEAQIKLSAESYDNSDDEHLAAAYQLEIVRTITAVIIGELSDKNFDLWIGKKDMYLYRIKTSDESIDKSSKNTGFKENIDINFSEFGKTINVQAPSESVDLGAIITKSLTEARNRAKNARIQADMNQIRTVAGIIYGDKKSFATFGCGSDENMKGLCDDIKTQGGSEPVIFSKADKYCVSAKILDNNYWCVDSNLVSRKTATPCDSKTFACPPAAR